MGATWKSLADGQLPGSKGTLYTVPALTTAAVTFLVAVNTDSSTRTVNLYICRSGSSSRRIINKDYSLISGASINACDDAQGIRLSAGDIIEGDADSAAKVDYTILGIEFA